MMIPDSVRDYVHDVGVRRAVSEMLALPDGALPEGTTWEELPLFYRARLAARQLETEWGLFAIAAWDEIWGGLLDGWTPLTPDDHAENAFDVGVDLLSLRNSDDGSLWFGRMFSKAEHVLYASLSAAPATGLRLKVSCESDDGAIDFDEIASVRDEFENWTCTPGVRLDAGQFAPSELRETARRAVAIADRALAAGGASRIPVKRGV